MAKSNKVRTRLKQQKASTNNGANNTTNTHNKVSWIFIVLSFFAGLWLGFFWSNASVEVIMTSTTTATTPETLSIQSLEKKKKTQQHDGSSSSSSSSSNTPIITDMNLLLSKPPSTPQQQKQEYPKSNITFGACVLIMDDSIRLLEWLAYHYTVLPLRRLMIAIDPSSASQQAVLDVLDLWKDRIDITTYTNDSTWLEYNETEGWGRRIYREDGTLANWFVTKSGPVYRSQSHKRRQNKFILHCMRKYKKRAENGIVNKKKDPNWLLMTDTDEFVLYNFIHANQENASHYELSRGYTKERIDEERRANIPLRHSLPPLTERIPIGDWLAVHGYSKSSKRPPFTIFGTPKSQCWRFPGRAMSFSTRHDSKNDNNHNNNQNLMTFQYRHGGLRECTFSKTMVDVSWGEMPKYTRDDVQNIHNPQKRICGIRDSSGSNADYVSSWFRIHHYQAGTLEAYTERAMDRRSAAADASSIVLEGGGGGKTDNTSTSSTMSYERYQERNAPPIYADDDIVPWIDWFISEVGTEEANRLLFDPLTDAYAKWSQHEFVLAHRND